MVSQFRCLAGRVLIDQLDKADRIERHAGVAMAEPLFIMSGFSENCRFQSSVV